ncbi:hypothetical protein ABIA95_004262 [Bradyrhizobium sp. LA8.1]|jgi:hypothetical protein
MERADGKSGQTRTNDAPICFPGSLGDQGQTGVIDCRTCATSRAAFVYGTA